MLAQIARGGFDARKNDVLLTVQGVVRLSDGRPTLAVEPNGAESFRLEIVSAAPTKSKAPDVTAFADRTVELTAYVRAVPNSDRPGIEARSVKEIVAKKTENAKK